MQRQIVLVTSTWFLTLAALFSSLVSSCSAQAAPDPCSLKAKITQVQFMTFPPSQGDGTVKFRLAIKVEGLPQSATGLHVLFDTKDPAHSVSGSGEPVAADGKEIQVEGAARPGTEVQRIRIAVGACTIADTKDFSITIKENPPEPKVKEFDIKLDHEKNKQFPNLHSLVLTREGGEGDGFANNPRHMTIDLMPSGATDITIVQTNPQQLDVHFIAAEDYEPTSAVVTVYSSSDLDTRYAIAVAVTKKTPPDPDKPKVTGTEIVFINRSQGIGRIRIFGEGFGDYAPPPYPVDDFLWNCLERFRIQGPHANEYELEDVRHRLDACARMLNGTKNDGQPDLVKLLESSKTNLASFVTLPPTPPDKQTWMSWGETIRDAVNVSIHSRNPDIGVEKVEIVNINDKMIDVYFEFRRYRSFAYPFRLESSNIIIKKALQKATQTVKNDKVTATITGPKEETYNIPYDLEPKRDPNLVYKYKVLDTGTANTLLGKGVAENFYVLQLSVVNTAAKKVAIPLAAIQAEIEWVRGTTRGSKNNNADQSGGDSSYQLTASQGDTSGENKKGKSANRNLGSSVGNLEGPPTLPPIPLAAVSSFFEAYQKSKGARAVLYNFLDAMTTWGAALVPFTGPSLKDAQVFWSGGFVPGLHKALGDLSSQQLQNLTSLSWESSETIPANGGSIEKMIYIPRKNPDLGSSRTEQKTTSQVANIMGLEVTGYEVTDSEPKAASPAGSTTKDKKPDAGATSEKAAGKSADKPAAKDSAAEPAKPKDE
jgi:hypothetical protein